MNYKEPFVELTEEKLMSDLETSRKQIEKGQCQDMKTALDGIGEKVDAGL
jgi:EAL domain-containing protein (putative c-di-GMP-specific phosphodiesterase class I)